ncbi:single-stranded-DNA-specific exonuclease C-terminal domain-containing protein, partial [Enterococcus faecalis]|uniref:single-stranded-DNA-specific exonuclease C-terminal domain-containing protein n=1 Tax=Enterococcus faecalis TaxID=1351 RepID=UPI003CC6621D
VSQNQIALQGVVDCPVEAITVKENVEATEIQRIYMMFISPEDAYLNGMASREQFPTLYKFILQKKEVNLRSQLSKVANYLS